MAPSQRGRDKVEKLRRALFRYKWDVAETIIGQIPKGTHLPNIHVDQEQWSVLHVAAMVKAPPALFEKILTIVDLEFCMQKDANGQNPLHRLGKGGNDIDSIRLLALARPQSFFEMSTSSEGQLIPLEYMLMDDDEESPRFTAEDVAMLITDIATVWPEGMFASFAEGESLLHMAIPYCIRRNDLSLAKAILDAAPALKERPDDNGQTPIHHAVHFVVCDKDYPRLGNNVVPLIELLVNNGDECGLDLMDASGRTPLHEACSKGLQRDVIEILVKRYPGALEMRDNKEMTPLALFRRRRRKVIQGHEVLAADVAMTLLTGTPLRCSDSPSLHPLLRNENCTMDIVRYLVTAMPGQASTKDENGDLPFHFIFSSQYHDANSEYAGDVVQQLLCAYPDACRITNHDGMLPFELMARSGNDWHGGMRLVFLQHPAAVTDLGLDRHSVCSLLERIGREETHDVMFRLLKDAPDLLL